MHDEIPFCLALAIISMCFMATLSSLSVMRDGISTCEAKENFPLALKRKDTFDVTTIAKAYTVKK